MEEFFEENKLREATNSLEKKAMTSTNAIGKEILGAVEAYHWVIEEDHSIENEGEC